MVNRYKVFLSAIGVGDGMFSGATVVSSKVKGTFVVLADNVEEVKARVKEFLDPGEAGAKVSIQIKRRLPEDENRWETVYRNTFTTPLPDK